MNTQEKVEVWMEEIVQKEAGDRSMCLLHVEKEQLARELLARNQQFQELRQEHEETLKRMQFYKEEWNELRIDRQELVEEVLGLKQLLKAVANHAAAAADAAGCEVEK
jgi:uncharacterized coiled-coil DUF342 family protein